MVSVQLESGNTVEMDAEKYMDELKKEAQSLRNELAALGEPAARAEQAISPTLTLTLTLTLTPTLTLTLTLTLASA